MARVKRGLASHAKHKKLLGLAKGYMMTRHRLVRKAHEAVLHAGSYAYAGRKNKKRMARRDWILHISEALKRTQSGSEGPHRMSYSVFINKLNSAKIALDRKVLAQLATEHEEIFNKLLTSLK